MRSRSNNQSDWNFSQIFSKITGARRAEYGRIAPKTHWWNIYIRNFMLKLAHCHGNLNSFQREKSPLNNFEQKLKLTKQKSLWNLLTLKLMAPVELTSKALNTW
jgi:hypothetical protein